MGISGTEVAKESADVIILDYNFSTTATVAKWGRSVYVNIQKFVQFQLTVNVVARILNCQLLFSLLDRECPLTAIQLLWVNMIMDTLGALALATEPPTDDLMNRSPVDAKEFSFAMPCGETSWASLFISLSSFGTFRRPGMQWCLESFKEISSREMEKINVFIGILDNYVFVCVLSCTAFFQVIVIEFLGTFANTHPLTWQQWSASVLIRFLGMPIAAAVKMIPVGSRIFSLTGASRLPLLHRRSSFAVVQCTLNH